MMLQDGLSSIIGCRTGIGTRKVVCRWYRGEPITMEKSGTQPIRKGMPSPRLAEVEFKRRFISQFQDPSFALLSESLDKIAAAAWDAYYHSRKSPRTHKAGPGFADPNYELAEDWLAAHEAVGAAQRQHDNPSAPMRILIVNGSARSEHTCPGEMSKSFRLAMIAKQTIETNDAAVEMLDLSRVASEYGRRIHPCKACFSTSPALCHWPCSCYPNYSLGQTQDWMNEIYPMWVGAHGIMIVTPVHWYQATSPLKLMIDRLVCADGGNCDPTLTHGKDAGEAKRIELSGWSYPRHLAGRLFAVIVHGDTDGVTAVRTAISDWLISMELQPAGASAELDRYIGYWKPYATSHEDLDDDDALQQEVRIAAETLVEAVKARRSGSLEIPKPSFAAPRKK